MRGPSKTELASASFSPLPADIETQIKAQFSVILKDPYSAVYTFGTPSKVYFQGPQRKMFGTAIPVSVNAKNSYGGYTGGLVYTWVWAEGNLYNATNSAKFGGIVPVQ